MKIGLKKELDKVRKKSINSVESIITEANRLLTAGADAEQEALRKAGLNHKKMMVETAQGVEIERKSFEEQYKDHVFTEEEIKNICIKYDLRFLRSEFYRGNLDTQLGSKLKKFIEDHPEVGNSSDSFYIMAPDNCFELIERPAKPFWTIKTDPVLMYKLPKQNKYVYIHKWGRDFTILRRLRGMLLSSLSNMWSVGISMWMVILSALFGILYTGFTGEWYQYFHLIWIAAIAVGANYAMLCIMFKDGENFRQRETDRIWNERIDRKVNRSY